MSVNKASYEQLIADLGSHHVTLVAVSKTKSAAEISELHALGQLDFGENYVQELVEKQAQLPNDIRWHFIGHLQSNKVKLISSFVHLIHGVDSLKLLKEIDKQAEKNNRVIDCLLQVHISKEETKFGLDEDELNDILSQIKNDSSSFRHLRIRGLMGMASFVDDLQIIRSEFKFLRSLFEKYQSSFFMPAILSMGMSSDYSVALDEGSTMVRIGSLLFGARSNV
jgi:pyridoxal phosphate enzyme (YggS family)